MENIKYGRRREGRWTPIRAKAQDTRANPNSSETHLGRKRWDIGLLRALNPRIVMMMMMMFIEKTSCNLLGMITKDLDRLHINRHNTRFLLQLLAKNWPSAIEQYMGVFYKSFGFPGFYIFF